MNRRIEYLDGWWDGELRLIPEIDVAAPEVIKKQFYIPLSWHMQIDEFFLRGSEYYEPSGITRPLQNQNFRDRTRKIQEGVISYSKEITIQNVGDKESLFLIFAGANYETNLDINGKHVGTHSGGHLPFEFDVTDYVHSGLNIFKITVDNRRRKDAIPQEQFNWKNYGGVYRPLRLEWRPKVHISDVLILPEKVDSDNWRVTVRTNLSRKVDAELKIDIISGDSTATSLVSTVMLSDIECSLTIKNPFIWQLGKGGMSNLRITLNIAGCIIDSRTIDFGIRDVSIKHGMIYVNGKSVRILGAAIHEQCPYAGNSVPAYQAEKDVMLLKYAGFNTLRAAHYPHAEHLYEICDREGVLVIAEMPCWQFNEHQFNNKELLSFAVEYASDIIKYLGNHPSIIAWMIENESDVYNSTSAKRFFEEIADVFKKEDSTRLTMCATQANPPEHLSAVKKVIGMPKDFTVPDASECFDVVGINQYAGWYAEKAQFLDALLDKAHEVELEKPIIVSEFGAEGILGQRSFGCEHYTEDYQASLLTRQISVILEREWIAGFILWLFIDYHTSSIGVMEVNSKGILDQYRRPKLAYDEVRKLLTEYREE